MAVAEEVVVREQVGVRARRGRGEGEEEGGGGEGDVHRRPRAADRDEKRVEVEGRLLHSHPNAEREKGRAVGGRGEVVEEEACVQVGG